MTELATYVYCVVARPKRDPSARAPKGLPGAKAPRMLDAGGGHQVLVASVPLARYSSEIIEGKLRDLDWVGRVASAHERVIEHALEAGTVVPMKLFTIFASDDRAVSHVRKMKRKLEGIVSRIEGCDEWGLRILFDEVKGRAARPAPKKAATGTGFLLRKKELHVEAQKLTAEAKRGVEDLFARLERAARRTQRRPAPNRELAGRVLLDAVFLVPRSGAAKFEAIVASAAEGLAKQGSFVSLSGPWPAYSFVEEP